MYGKVMCRDQAVSSCIRVTSRLARVRGDHKGIWMQDHICKQIFSCTHIGTWICMCIYIYIYTFIYACTYTYIYIYTLCVRSDIHVYICIYAYMSVKILVHIYVEYLYVNT